MSTKLVYSKRQNRSLSNEAAIQANNMQASQNLSIEHVRSLSNELDILRETKKRDQDEYNNEVSRLKAICGEYEVHLRNETERLENLINLKQATIERLNEEIDSLNTSIEAEKHKFLQLKQTNENILESVETLQTQLYHKQTYIDTITSEYEEKLNNLNQNKSSTDSELQVLIEAKQKINDSLIIELNELKQVIESQRLSYEEKLSKLMEDIREREEKIADISMTRDESLLQKNASFEINLNESTMSENNDAKQNMNLTNKCSHLEAQLKYCHEKCEKVVLKLNQLKKQNESLNNKIKSIKSMAFV
jgi:hypothetical protein